MLLAQSIYYHLSTCHTSTALGPRHSEAECGIGSTAVDRPSALSPCEDYLEPSIFISCMLAARLMMMASHPVWLL